MAKSQHQRHETIQRGQVAAMARGEVGDRIWQRELDVIDRLVASYVAGKLTHETTVGGIAEIRSLRDLRRQIEREVEEGQQALAEEITHGNPI